MDKQGRSDAFFSVEAIMLGGVIGYCRPLGRIATLRGRGRRRTS